MRAGSPLPSESHARHFVALLISQCRRQSPNCLSGSFDRLRGRGYHVLALRVIGLQERDPSALPRQVRLHDTETDPLQGVLAAAAALRAQGHTVSLTVRRKKAGKQLDELQRQGFEGAASLGVEGGAPEVKWFDPR